jgi:uncharacterized protein
MRSVLKYFIVTFIVSWTFWLAAGAVVNWNASRASPFAGLLYLLGVFAPAFVAVAFTESKKALLGGTIKWSESVRWYVFAAGYFVTLKLAVAVIYRIAIGTWPAFNQEPWLLILVATIFSTPVQAGEEIGWRGYALPRMSKDLGLPLASLILGIVWAVWHLPFFFFPGVDKTGQSFPIYTLTTTALSVAMAWLYWRTNGSLLLTMLMHAAVNNMNMVPAAATASSHPWHFRTTLVGWLSVALLWLGAAYFLVRMRGAKLESVERVTERISHCHLTSVKIAS